MSRGHKTFLKTGNPIMNYHFFETFYTFFSYLWTGGFFRNQFISLVVLYKISILQRFFVMYVDSVLIQILDLHNHSMIYLKLPNQVKTTHEKWNNIPHYTQTEINGRGPCEPSLTS